MNKTYPVLLQYLQGAFQVRSERPDSRIAGRQRFRISPWVGGIPDPNGVRPALLPELTSELRLLMNEHAAEEELAEILFNKLGCRVDLRPRGASVREWLNDLLLSFEDRLQAEVWKNGLREPSEVRAARLRPAVAQELKRIGVQDLAARIRQEPDSIIRFLGGETPPITMLDSLDFYEFSMFPDLKWLMGAYLYEGFSDDIPAAWESTVRDYVRLELPGRVRGTIVDIDHVLTIIQDEAETQRIIEDMGCAFTPASVGMGYREWLSRVRGELSSTGPL